MPHYLVERVPEDKVEALVRARWQEHQLEQHLHQAAEPCKQTSVIEMPRTTIPLIETQVQLCRHTLERAKLEVEIYSEALKQPVYLNDIGKPITT